MTNHYIKSLILTTLFFFLTGSAAFAQEDNSIKGFVYEESTGEPMMFTNVYLKGTTFGGATNENGYFNINRIPDGRYTLLITSVGYDTISETFNLSKGQSINRKYYMKETRQTLLAGPEQLGLEKLAFFSYLYAYGISQHKLGDGNGNPLQYSCLGSYGQGSLVGCCPWGRTESDTTEVT